MNGLAQMSCSMDMSRDVVAMEIPQNSFAERLALVVKKAGNAVKLANETGISRRVIGKYLSGGTNPSYKRMVAIAEATGVNVEWLATGKGTMLPHVQTPKEMDEELLTEVIQAVDEAVQQYATSITSQKKAKLINFVYTECLHDRQAVAATARKFVDLLL